MPDKYKIRGTDNLPIFHHPSDDSKAARLKHSKRCMCNREYLNQGFHEITTLFRYFMNPLNCFRILVNSLQFHGFPEIPEKSIQMPYHNKKTKL